MTKLLRVTILLFLIGLVLYGVIGWINSFKPPTPSVTVGETKIPTAQGTFCWEGLISYKCVDMISPDGIVEHHDMKPVVVAPNAKIKIDFRMKPKKGTLGANLWNSDNEIKNARLKGNTLTAPKEKGIYIYSIHANWEKGDSSYVFVIEVR